MADLYASRAPVRLNDGTADANNAAVLGAAPASGDYALAVRQVGIPAAAALADAAANPTVVSTGSYLMGWNSATWDRLTSTTANGLDVDVTRVSGNVTVVQGTASNLLAQVVGPVALDGAAAAINPVLVGTYASAAAPADVSADGDAVRLWALRNGSLVTNLASAGTLITVGQKAMAGSIPVVLPSDGVGADATHTIHAVLGTGAADYTLFGQTQAASPYTRLTDGTTVPGVIVATTALKTDLASVAGTVTVTANIAGVQSVGGGTAADAAIAAYPITVGARGSTALPTAMSTDGDVVNLWASLNGALNVVLRDASGTYVAAGGGTQYVGDAAITATPTGGVEMGLANAAAPTDVTANNDAVAAWYLRNGSQVMNIASGGTLITVGAKTAAASFPVVLATDQLPASAALADATANPTLSGIGSYLMGYNGATWDRVRTANTGRLQVDVVTGGSSAPASGLPSGYNALAVYGTAAGVAAGATSSAVVTNTPANTKPFYIRTVRVTASGQTKALLKFGATVLDTMFQSQEVLDRTVWYDPPIAGTGDGSTALTIDVINREASAMDVYAMYRGYVLA